MEPSRESVQDCVRRALAEDLGAAGAADDIDVTVAASVPPGTSAKAVIEAREDGVLAGLAVAEACFTARDPDVSFVGCGAGDGADLAPGAVIATIHGTAAGLLSAERTALNFLQRLSGVATRTAQFVAAVEGLPVRIMDTRKTTPMLREFEKYAVRVGGGTNHRAGLFDQILLKENHFALAGRPYEEVVRAAVAASPQPVVAEARTIEEALAAVAGGAAVVMLDNFEPGPDLRQAAARVRRTAAETGGTVEVEASGGVTLSTVRAFAECGVDRISVGALTHSVEALDMSMLTSSL